MYRVLLPIDEHDARARAQAEAVRDQPAAGDALAVDVLHVHEGVSAPDAEWAAGGISEEFAEEMAEQARDAQRLPGSVGVAIDVLEADGVEYTVHETTGEPTASILEAAAEFDSDVIVLGVGDRSPVGKVLFGSAAQAVILASDRPVMVVPAGDGDE